MPNVPITEIGKTPRIVSNEMGKASLHEIISRPSSHKVCVHLKLRHSNANSLITLQYAQLQLPGPLSPPPLINSIKSPIKDELPVQLSQPQNSLVVPPA